MIGELPINIMYLRINYDINEHFQINFNPTIGSDNKKYEIANVKKQFFIVLQEDIADLYKQNKEIRANLQKNNAISDNIGKPKDNSSKIIKESLILNKVETIGKKIYQNLFPRQLQDYINKFSISTIVIQSEKYLVPFELMHNGEYFLATRIKFYRDPILIDEKHLKVLPNAENLPVQVVFFTNPTRDLPGAELEAKELINSFQSKKLKNLQIENFRQEKASYKALSKVFDAPRLDIFHYSGHSGVENNDIYFQLLETPFSVTDIFLQYPAVFFLNMCESDICIEQKLDFGGNITLNFPLEVMKRGAKACIATLWPIVDQTAAEFAQVFYEQILRENTFGDAILSAKVKTSESSSPNDITWLSFILYGSPRRDTITFPKQKISETVDSNLPTSITTFLSYSTKDFERFSIIELTKKLSEFKDLKVLKWDEPRQPRDVGENAVLKVIQKTLYFPPLEKLKMIDGSDIFLLLCSKNSKQSISVNSDWFEAYKTRKPIIPIIIDPLHIPEALQFSGIEPIQFIKESISKTAASIHEAILKTIKNIRHNFELTKYLYDQAPLLVDYSKKVVNPWEIKFPKLPILPQNLKPLTQAEMKQKGAHPMNSENPTGIWRVENNYFYPYYGAEMIWLYDHRYQSYAETKLKLKRVSLENHQNPKFSVISKYWIARDLAEPGELLNYFHGWLIGYRTKTNDFGARTGIFSILPRIIMSDSLSILITDRTPREVCCLFANLTSIVLDYLIRQKFPGSYLNSAVIERLPIFSPDFYTKELIDLVVPLVIELTYTSWDLRSFALDCGINCPPYDWNPEKRAILQAQLDAIYAHLYKLEREELEYLLETFSALKHEESVQFGGEYRTKNLILDAFKQLSPKIKKIIK